jgi:hypothetical protein
MVRARWRDEYEVPCGRAPALRRAGRAGSSTTCRNGSFIDLERRQLRAQVRWLAAGDDPHRLRPRSQLVAAPAGSVCGQEV